MTKKVKPALGYFPNGKKLEELPPGSFATAAIVTCKGCNKVVRGAGGPIADILCPDCWEAAGT